MKLYQVRVTEVHYATYRIEAENEEDAINKVREGEGEELYNEYDHTLSNDEDKWIVSNGEV